MAAETETKAETETETETPKPKRRPIVRLGIFLISHSIIFSVVCFVAGVLALLLLPVLAKNTYISENALMPGSARSMLSSREVSEAGRLLDDIASLNQKSASTGIESKRLVAQYMSNLGAEVSYHKFHPQLNKFHPLQFFSSPDSEIIQDNISCSAHGLNIVGIVRAPRGDGKESIVLVTPYDFVKNGADDNLSLGIAYSMFSLLSEVTWLAKDIIWLVADSQYGDYASVSAWLKDYHTSVFSGVGMPNPEMCQENNIPYELKDNLIADIELSNGDFKRAGTMAAAFVIKVAKRNEQYEDTLSIYAEASNGQMPNLDLINIVNYLAVHGQGLRVKVEKSWHLLESKWLGVLGEIFESIGKIARSLNPQWKFGIPAADYIDGSATLASSLYYQALGIPTGPHGAFRDYQVDAITLEISPSSSNKVKRNEFLLRRGRLIEGVIRSVNNLLEKFHQSFFIYLLTSPSKFVSVGVYMIAFALLIAPLPLVSASLYFDANELNPSKESNKPTPDVTPTITGKLGNTLRSWKWLKAAKQVSAVHLWGAFVSFLPYFIDQIPICTPTTSFAIWFVLSFLSLLLLYFVLSSSQFSYSNSSDPQKQEWAILKSVTISAAFIGLGLMSVINFATAEIGALLMAPMCMLVRPLILEVRDKSGISILRAGCNLALGVIVFPPATFFLLKGISAGFSSLSAGDYWSWVESLWLWNSATYLYIGMIHLPCWVLCINILLYPVNA